MPGHQKIAIFLSRIAIGWLFFYAGITKVLNPSWSAAGYLKGASTFKGLYTAMTAPEVLPFINFLNQWGLTLIGVALILGVLTKFSSYMGALMMLLYYFPELNFPKVGEHSMLVDEHIIYALLFVLLASLDAGKVWGLDSVLAKRKSK